jgi:hypothetical protein
MLEQTLLREQFEALLAQHREAIGIYESASACEHFDDEIRAKLAEVCREKKRHIELTQRLLEILE